MRLYNMIGYKLYKENEDGSIHMIRISGMRKPFKINEATKDPSEITIYDYDDNETKKVKVETLKEYHPIKPDGIFTASIVNINDGNGNINKDVIVTGTKYLNIELKIQAMPYCVCRQSITDIFYNLFAKDATDTLVGLSVNQDTCPANFDIGIMFAADSVVFNEFINFYRTDTIDDILKFIKIDKYDAVLKDLYLQHVKYTGKPELSFKNEHGGWCRDLKTLLTQNNFQEDLNQMLGITNLGFEINQYLVDKTGKINDEDITYQIASDDFKYWLSSIYKVSINEITFIEFDHDINLADYNNARYLLLRDTTNKLYLAVYTVEGEYLESDLEAKSKEYDFTTKFKIDFFNKYNNKK